jgi:hypothetical protein
VASIDIKIGILDSGTEARNGTRNGTSARGKGDRRRGEARARRRS